MVIMIGIFDRSQGGIPVFFQDCLIFTTEMIF